MSLGSLQSLTRFCGKVVNSNCCASVHLGCHSLIWLECLWCPLLLPVQTHQLNEFICAHAKDGSHPKVPAWFLIELPELFLARFQKWVCMVPLTLDYKKQKMLLKPWCAFKTELRNHHDTHYSRSGCVWFLLLLIIKNKKCCWSHGVLSKRNWGTIMIPISWYGKHVNWSTIAAQLPFQSKSTVLENMSIQWKTCQGWTSRYIFVDMLTKCQLLVILVCYHPSGQAWPSIQGGGPRISLTSTFGKVIFILKSDLVNWVNCSFCSTHPGLYLLFSSCANASIKLCERMDEWKECQRQ